MAAPGSASNSACTVWATPPGAPAGGSSKARSRPAHSRAAARSSSRSRGSNGPLRRRSTPRATCEASPAGMGSQARLSHRSGGSPMSRYRVRSVAMSSSQQGSPDRRASSAGMPASGGTWRHWAARVGSSPAYPMSLSPPSGSRSYSITASAPAWGARWSSRRPASSCGEPTRTRSRPTRPSTSARSVLPAGALPPEPTAGGGAGGPAGSCPGGRVPRVSQHCSRRVRLPSRARRASSSWAALGVQPVTAISTPLARSRTAEVAARSRSRAISARCRATTFTSAARSALVPGSTGGRGSLVTR